MRTYSLVVRAIGRHTRGAGSHSLSYFFCTFSCPHKHNRLYTIYVFPHLSFIVYLSSIHLLTRKYAQNVSVIYTHTRSDTHIRYGCDTHITNTHILKLSWRSGTACVNVTVIGSISTRKNELLNISLSCFREKAALYSATAT